jgi:hypothetical protein
MATENDDEPQVEALPGGFLRVADEPDDNELYPQPPAPAPTPTAASATGNGELGELRARVAQLEADLRRARASSKLEALDAKGEEPASARDLADAIRVVQAELDARQAQLAELYRQNYDDVCDAVAERTRARIYDDLADDEPEPDDNSTADAAASTNAGKGKRGGKSARSEMRVGRKRGRGYIDGDSGTFYVWSKPSEDDEVPADGEVVIPT